MQAPEHLSAAGLVCSGFHSSNYLNVHCLLECNYARQFLVIILWLMSAWQLCFSTLPWYLTNSHIQHSRGLLVPAVVLVQMLTLSMDIPKLRGSGYGTLS